MLLGSRARWKSRHRDSEDEQKYALHRVASRLGLSWIYLPESREESSLVFAGFRSLAVAVTVFS